MLLGNKSCWQRFNAGFKKRCVLFQGPFCSKKIQTKVPSNCVFDPGPPSSPAGTGKTRPKMLVQLPRGVLMGM